MCDINVRREILVCKSKLTGRSWREVIIPGLPRPSQIGHHKSTAVPRWSQMTLACGGKSGSVSGKGGGGNNADAADNDEENIYLWSLLQTNRDLFCSPTNDLVFADFRRDHSSSSPSSSSSKSRDSAVVRTRSSTSLRDVPPSLPPLDASHPWRLSIPDENDSFSCISACEQALWGLTPRGDVWVRAEMSRQRPLGTGWRKVDMVQLGSSVVFIAVGKNDVSIRQ